MKIIFLNAWNAKRRADLSSYLRAHVVNTDIFCFQEAHSDMQQLCREILAEYAKYTDYKYLSEHDDFPQATYVRKGLQVLSSGTILKEQANCGIGLYVEVQTGAQSLFVCNFHGASWPWDKRDNPDRITQSKTLIEFFADKERTVIGGDFNLFPDTDSIRMFSQHGYRDLIKEFDIKTTRSQISFDMHPGSDQYWADYAFLKPNVQLKNFAVPDNLISDHLPLEVEIDG